MKILDKIEEIFISISILVATLLVFINVVLRFFGNGLIWSEELIRFLLIAVTFIGISVCVREDAHVSIDFIPDLLKRRARNVLLVTIYLIAIVFSCLLTWYGVEFSNFSRGTGQVAPSLNIPMFIVYLTIPISGILMIVRYVQRIIHLLRPWNLYKNKH